MRRAAASFLVLLAFGVSALVGVAEPAHAAESTPCWKRVLDDWSEGAGIEGKYSAKCIEEAIANVPEDVRAYTDFEEQARAARLAANRTLQSAGGGQVTAEDLAEREPRTGDDSGSGAKDETPIQNALGTRGNNADSFPLPLLILLILAAALIAAGGAGFAHRKLRVRRAS